MTAQAQFPDEQSESGEFDRQEDAFRNWVEADPEARHPAEAGRYHLYVSYACPWAHRIIILRSLKRLESVIGMTVVDPLRDDRGWRFSYEPDPVNNFTYLAEAYRQSEPDYRGRVTVPVLWDKELGQIVTNSDDDLMRMVDQAFDAYTDVRLDLTPADLLPEIDRLNEVIYETVNNEVYKAGFATTQKAYDLAVWQLFDTLDMLEARLSRMRYLFGPRPVETDWRLFVTLLRFDPVYHGHFKCNLRKIDEYPNLSGYLRDLYQTPGVAQTVNLDHIKRHYYVTHDHINPSKIVPAGPEQFLTEAHLRD